MSIRNQLQSGIYRVINPLVKLLIRAGLTPNMVTTIGLLLNIGVSIIFIAGAEEGKRGDLSYVGWAGALIFFAGLFDMLDGQVARLGNMSSRFGALYDSVLDRYSELILFLGICYYLVAHHYFLSSLFAFIGMIGSLMVSYTRARAEGLGIECKDGLMQRPERVILIAVSALGCGIASHFIGGNYKIHWPHSSFPVFETISIFTIPLTIMAVLANATAIGRLRDAKKSLEQQAVAQAAARAAGQIGQAGQASAGQVGQAAAGPGTPSILQSSPIAPSSATAAGSSSPIAPATAATPVGTASSAASAAPSAAKKIIPPGAPIWLLIILSAFISSGLSGHAQNLHYHPAKAMFRDAQDTFPVPPHTGGLLFYLQRTPNTNTIIYELNEKDGIPDKEDPVHALWIRYPEHRQRQELSFLQRHFAFGLKTQDLGNDTYELRFVSYKKLPLYLKRSPLDNQHHVYVAIGNRQAILDRVFIKINPGGTFWSPNIEYLELKGKDADNGKELMQRIKI